MNRTSGYRADIDGMRAIAVASVVVYHAFPGALQRGFLGVDMFFVISGFLITGIISDDLHAGTFSIADFYARRVRRIAPALIVVLAASFGLGWLLMLPIDYRQFGAHMIGGSLFFSNLQFWLEIGYFDKASELKPLLHLWSLSVEEQFYLVWPWFLVWVMKSRITPMIATVGIAALSFAAQAALARQDPSAAYYLPFARLWELMLGAIVALSYQYHPRGLEGFVRNKPIWHVVASVLGLGLVITSLSAGRQDGPVPAWWALLATGGTALLILVGLNNGFSRSVLGSRGIVGLGAISYPLYLWHWPLLVFLRIASQGEISAWSRLAVIFLSTGLAWLTYVWVERPVRFSRHRTRLVPILCVSLVCLSIIGFADYRGNGLAFRIPEPLRDYVSKRYDYAAGARVGRCWLSANAAYDGFDPTCFQDDDPGKKTVLVWGDSHAGRLYVGIANEYGKDFNIGQLTRDFCPPVLGFWYETCVKNNAYAVSLIEKHPPNLVLLFAVWNRYERNFQASKAAILLQATIERLKAAGTKHILIVGPAPQWNDNLPNLLAKFWRAHMLNPHIPAVMKFGLEEGPFDVDRQLEALIPREMATYVSLTDLLCSPDGCRTQATEVASGLITADRGHLTAAGADYVARFLPIRELLRTDQ